MVKSCRVLQIRAKNTRGIAQLVGTEKQREPSEQFAHRTVKKKERREERKKERKKMGYLKRKKAGYRRVADRIGQMRRFHWKN